MSRRAPNADQEASCCSLFLFRYANDLVSKGYEGSIGETDIWNVHDEDVPTKILGAFLPFWEEEQKKKADEVSLVAALRRFLYWRYVACVGASCFNRHCSDEIHCALHHLWI